MMAPSSVLRRINDQLVAPRASRGELLVAYATALASVALATALAADAGLSALPLVVVAVVPGFGWAAAAVVYGLVVAGAVVVLAAPLELRRPVAFAATVLAVPAVLLLATVPDSLAWFAPVPFAKLLLGHLLPGEAAHQWAPASSGG
jgi:hypothetical protein